MKSKKVWKDKIPLNRINFEKLFSLNFTCIQDLRISVYNLAITIATIKRKYSPSSEYLYANPKIYMFMFSLETLDIQYEN